MHIWAGLLRAPGRGYCSAITGYARRGRAGVRPLPAGQQRPRRTATSVDTGPTQVSLTFNEDMPPGFDKVAVIGPDGTAWQTGEVTTSGPTISITVSPLGPAGRYQVGYRVVSGDGHPVQGSTSFVLTKAGTGTPPTQPAATGTPVAGGASGASSGGGSPVWPWIAAAVVVIGVGVVVALRLGRT